MIEIKVDTSGLDRLARQWQAKAKQIPFATSLAINRTAQEVRKAEQHEIQDSFDRPTPTTLNSIRVINSTKATLKATVYVQNELGKGNAPSKYLLTTITGGFRASKRYENALRAAGVLPEGMVTVPGKAAIIDQFGNMSRGQIVQILSYFKAAERAGYRVGYTANITDKRRERMRAGTKTKRGIEYFVGRPADGKLPLGIWQRITQFARHGDSTSAIKPILIFVERSTYQRYFEFKRTAELAVEREWPRQIERALRDAMATAR